MSSLPQFCVSINGQQMHAVYDSSSAFSSISLQFCTKNLFLSKSPPVTFTIVTSAGTFTSTMAMHVSNDQVEDVIFGRDWFNYCSADPYATMDLIEPGMCLRFGASAQSCIRALSSPGQILMIPLL
jgi:hypothetical protein